VPLLGDIAPADGAWHPRVTHTRFARKKRPDQVYAIVPVLGPLIGGILAEMIAEVASVLL
jgi:glycerol uptake facilitator-like aquaporin